MPRYKASHRVPPRSPPLQTSQGKKLLLDKQVASLQTALKSTSLLMEHGNTTYLEVLTARQTLLSAQLSQTANHFTEIQSLINLFQYWIYCSLSLKSNTYIKNALPKEIL